MNRATALAPTMLIAFAFLASCAGERAPASPPTAAAAAQPPAAAPATEAPSIDATLASALAGPERTDKERARDGARHPKETLEFFGLRPDATVVELWAGSGYYTAILAPVLADRGQLVESVFDQGGDQKDWYVKESKWTIDRLAKNPTVFGKVKQQTISRTDYTLGPDGSADFVFTFRNVHNWVPDKTADAIFTAIARVLKQGGVLGVEDHRGKPGMTMKEIEDTGYIPEDQVIALASKVGLKLVDRSEINANAKDTKDYPNGVWSLPPSYAGKDVDREKFAAIGESDRMTLKFQKP